jgi:hypothetical protein
VVWGEVDDVGDGGETEAVLVNKGERRGEAPL